MSNSKSAVAVLTWNRLPALRCCLESFYASLPVEAFLGVFEDAGEKDDTRGYLDSLAQREEPGYAAVVHLGVRPPHGGPGVVENYLGTRNLGVAGNSNRALRWFLETTNADHLLLCNDDVEAHGDFAAFYRQAHEDLGVGMFSFCDLPDECFLPARMPVGNYVAKLHPQMTGIMLSMTRECVERTGYFDVRLGKFGQEHCEYTNRARLLGFMSLEGQPLLNLDVECGGLLTSQPVASTVTEEERAVLNGEATQALQHVSARYLYEGLHRPFRLPGGAFAGLHREGGIKTENLAGYAVA